MGYEPSLTLLAAPRYRRDTRPESHPCNGGENREYVRALAVGIATKVFLHPIRALVVNAANISERLRRFQQSLAVNTAITRKGKISCQPRRKSTRNSLVRVALARSVKPQSVVSGFRGGGSIGQVGKSTLAFLGGIWLLQYSAHSRRFCQFRFRRSRHLSSNSVASSSASSSSLTRSSFSSLQLEGKFCSWNRGGRV